jgi:hypothetical protein
MAFPQRNTPVPRMTLATQAALIIRDEYIARARAEAAALDNDALRQRARTLVAETAAFFTEAGEAVPDYLPNPETMAREEMIELVADDTGDAPFTDAIPGDADDPLVLDALDLRREDWERNVAATIQSMGLTGHAAARHRATAEEVERSFVQQLVDETWELREADLRIRAFEIVAKLAGGSDGVKTFPYDPHTLSRGYVLAAIARHIGELAGAQVRPQAVAAE